MELSVDIGSDIHDVLLDLAEKKGKKLEVVAAEMLSLGARISAQSEEKSIDRVMQVLLENTCQSNELIIELVHQLFQKDKSHLNAFDAATAVAIVERMAQSRIKGLL